ncbi:quinone-dependent dihydroorotate dehydrogenase [Entomobacter blattae]|uniref:quinone-dependent dihydroorotate dehydrogenase n=1 Tax=Entomobacter blattae TaxID=2762277 RepID=UPI0038D077D9
MSYLTHFSLPILMKMDPEQAHNLAILGFSWGVSGRSTWDKKNHYSLSQQVQGLAFSNPLGLAAGFDKNGQAVPAMGKVGFGFVEIGTVTPRAQPGNAKPRLFRLKEDRGIINRMGFNNEGIEKVFSRLAAFIHARNKRKTLEDSFFPVGVNIGINKEGADPLKDYPFLVGRVKAYADYIVINVSSPNTPGLRDLQQADHLKGILEAINHAHSEHPPLFVKLAPDIEDQDLPSIVQTIIEGGAQGIIITNTTLQRPEGLQSPFAKESGGLSGRPLRELSLAKLKKVAEIAKGSLTLISVGGIETGQDVWERLKLGADLVQIYTAFIYEGPEVVNRIKQELKSILSKNGFSTLQDAIKAFRKQIND